MACLKLGSKADGFQRKGQAWFCTSGLPSDIVIEVEEMSFHLHKFPLISRSGTLANLIEEALQERSNDVQSIQLPDIPGGAETFELAAKFCYGVRLELTAANVVLLQCVAEYLEMTEEFGEDNLISKTEGFLTQVVIQNWKESIRALRSCEGSVLAKAEELGVVKRLLDSIASKACPDCGSLGWPLWETQSPRGNDLWNGISVVGAKPRNPPPDWWHEDVSVLSLPLYARLISAMEARGVKGESIAGAVVHFARRYLPVINRRQGIRGGSSCFGSLSLTSEVDQKNILETAEHLLPMQKGVVPTNFLSGMLQSAMILNASPSCRSNLERRIGLQLEQASLEDLLFPSLSPTLETLYDIDCVQRILDHFLLLDQSGGVLSSPCSVDEGHIISSPTLTPMVMVGRLVDSYLGEVASDVNLKLAKFQFLAEALPEFARAVDDGLYRAIDIYLKAHPWLREEERERVCRIMDCQKLSLEACTHAAQNERLPMRLVVQVLFFEQMQLRTAIASGFMVSDVDLSRTLRGTTGDLRGGDGCLANTFRENQLLKVGMDNMKLRVSELEQECRSMKQEIQRVGKARRIWRMFPKMLGGANLKSQSNNQESLDKRHRS